MFGYNVEYPHTAGALLDHEGQRVFNAAVPSWGPAEYVQVARELVPRHRPTHLVFVANVANDWFESEAPNRLRTTERDGWLVARHPDLDLEEPLAFPGAPFPPRPLPSRLCDPQGREPRRRQHAAPGGSGRPARRTSGRAPRLPTPAHRSRLTRHLLAARDVCGCTVIATALPLDVQVYAGEWAKYGARPRDLRSTEALAADFLADAETHGIATVDLMPVLRAASPGAFLTDDYHLSPEGHRAIAQALQEQLP